MLLPLWLLLRKNRQRGPVEPIPLATPISAASSARSSRTDSSGYANILPPCEPSSSRRSSASVNNRNGRGAAITNSTRVVNLVDSDVDSSSGSRPPKVSRVCDPAGCPKEAETAADSEEKGKADRSQKLKDELVCSICLNLCYEACTVSCSHTFCKSCLIDSLRACGNRCPNCREEVTIGREGPLVNYMIWNSIQLLFPEECAQRKTAMESKKTEAGNDPLPTLPTPTRPRMRRTARMSVGGHLFILNRRLAQQAETARRTVAEFVRHRIRH